MAAQDSIELHRLGLNVHVLVSEGSPIHENLSKEKDLCLHPIAFQPRNYFDFKLRKKLLKIVREEGINLIHTHQTSLVGSITPWFWKERQMVLMASRHIMSNHSKRDPFHTLIYRRLDALIVMSETLRQNVVHTQRLRERQLKTVRLGLDFEKFDPDRVDAKRQRAQWGADDDTVVIGMVGRIDPAKGQSTFIKAAAGLTKMEGIQQKFKFVIVGEQTLGQTSAYLEELQKMVAQFHLQNEIFFAGYQQDIPEVMDAFDIFVMPSRQEAFGLVAIEAMAMCCPIVITNGGSAAEIVGNEEFGLLFRPQDAFDLQRQLRFFAGASRYAGADG